jgi:hypothetical protein
MANLPRQYPCLDVDSLSNTTWNDVCVVSNLITNYTAYGIAQKALHTCCGPDNVFTTDDTCYTYCNITTPYDTVMISNCLLDTLDWYTSNWLDFDCLPLAWELNATYTTQTDAGKIATTWTTLPYVTFTFTSEDGAVYTETFDGSGNLLTGTPATTTTTTTTGAGKTTSSAGSTATKTSSAKSTTSTSTTASPTSSKSASKASPGMHLSYGTGVLVALSVLALVL